MWPLDLINGTRNEEKSVAPVVDKLKGKNWDLYSDQSGKFAAKACFLALIVEFNNLNDDMHLPFEVNHFCGFKLRYISIIYLPQIIFYGFLGGGAEQLIARISDDLLRLVLFSRSRNFGIQFLSISTTASVYWTVALRSVHPGLQSSPAYDTRASAPCLRAFECVASAATRLIAAPIS